MTGEYIWQYLWTNTPALSALTTTENTIPFGLITPNKFTLFAEIKLSRWTLEGTPLNTQEEINLKTTEKQIVNLFTSNQ